MHLARLFLDSSSGLVRSDIANPEGLHRTVMRMFPSHAGPEPRKAFDVLHRFDQSHGGRVTLLVQSRVDPDLAALPSGYLLDLSRDPDLVHMGVRENPSVRALAAERRLIRNGDRFMFRLKANTTKKIATKSIVNGNRTHGKRVPLRGEEAKIGWLSRYAEAGGFKTFGLRVRDVETRGREVRLAGTIYDGTLQVVNCELFHESLTTGIGPAKAFGFGLLSLSRSQGT